MESTDQALHDLPSPQCYRNSLFTGETQPPWPACMRPSTPNTQACYGLFCPGPRQHRFLPLSQVPDEPASLRRAIPRLPHLRSPERPPHYSWKIEVLLTFTAAQHLADLFLFTCSKTKAPQELEPCLTYSPLSPWPLKLLLFSRC